MEILGVDSSVLTLRDLAELERYENLKEVHLRWLDDHSVKRVLPMLKRCTNLRRLTLMKWEKTSLPSSEELCDFIMELKHLTFLHIIYRDIFNCGHFKSLLDKVKAFVLPGRPNFKFYVSCCSRFAKNRVSGREFFSYWIFTMQIQLNEWHDCSFGTGSYSCTCLGTTF